MAYLTSDNGIKCHWNFKLLPSGFLAITLFGHVFFNKPKSYVERYLNTLDGKYTMNHEYIHVLQANSFKTKYLGFYLYYIWYWFIGLFKYGVKKYASYKNIPFEREAFRNATNLNYKETKWRDYIEK